MVVYNKVFVKRPKGIGDVAPPLEDKFRTHDGVSYSPSRFTVASPSCRCIDIYYDKAPGSVGYSLLLDP